MKKEDLIALGIDEEVAKNVMALHGRTVTQLKAQLATVENERDTANEQLETNQTELDALKKAAEGNEELTTKLEEYQQKLNEAEQSAKMALAEKDKDFAIKLALKEANALDEGIVLNLLDRDTIKVTEQGVQGLNEQLEALKTDKAFLFQQEEQKPATPQIVAGGNPTTVQTGRYDLAKMTTQELRDLRNTDPEAFKQLTQ